MLREDAQETCPNSARAASVSQRLLIAVVSGLLAIPYAIAGPGWFREDFASLWNARLLGALDAAGPVVGGNRPGTALVYALVFGPLGDHPAAAHVLIVGLLTAVALVLRRLLERHVGAWAATAVALVYLVLPSQSSIVHWASTTNVLVALLALLWGLDFAEREQRFVSGLLVGIGVLCYEAILPAAVAAWAVLAWRRKDRRMLVAPGICVAPAAVWVSGTTTNADPLFLRLGDGVASLFGWGIADADPLWRFLLLGIAILIGIVGARAILGRVVGDDRPEQLLAAGLVTIALGYAPFLLFGFGMDFTGQGDRANFLSTIGAAMVLVGVGWRVAAVAATRQLPAAVALLVAFAALAVPTRVRNDRHWADVWEQTRAALDRANARVEVGERVVVIPECPIEINGVQGIDTAFSATVALRWRSGERGVIARCGG